MVLGMHILKEVCYMTTSFPANNLFYNSVFFQESAWSHPYAKDTVFISKHLLQTSITTSDLWLIQEKLKSMFISEKSLFFKGTYLFRRTNIFRLKSTVLNV